MSERALAFVESWIENNIHAEGYPPEGDQSDARRHAESLIAAAKEDGISKAEIEAETDDIVDYVGQAIERTNDIEVERSMSNDD